MKRVDIWPELELHHEFSLSDFEPPYVANGVWLTEFSNNEAQSRTTRYRGSIIILIVQWKPRGRLQVECPSIGAKELWIGPEDEGNPVIRQASIYQAVMPERKRLARKC